MLSSKYTQFPLRFATPLCSDIASLTNMTASLLCSVKGKSRRVYACMIMSFVSNLPPLGIPPLLCSFTRHTKSRSKIYQDKGKIYQPWKHHQTGFLLLEDEGRKTGNETNKTSSNTSLGSAIDRDNARGGGGRNWRVGRVARGDGRGTGAARRASSGTAAANARSARNVGGRRRNTSDRRHHNAGGGCGGRSRSSTSNVGTWVGNARAGSGRLARNHRRVTTSHSDGGGRGNADGAGTGWEEVSVFAKQDKSKWSTYAG